MLSASVTCLLCGHTAATLARHLKAAHGTTADEYRARFPEARIRSEACEANRKAAIAKAHEEKPREGLKKTITCPSCQTSHEVGLTFASKDHRCPVCKDREEWAGKVEGKDFVTCLGCGHRAENLTSHIQNAHPEWVGCYPSQVVALNSSIRDKTALRGRTVSSETRARMSASAGWNRGLTKETDERVQHAAEAMRGRASWSKGLTKADHPSLRSTSEKLSLVKRGVPNDAARLDLSQVDFTPYLDETGAVDRKTMAEELGVSEPTVTKYMGALGLRLSTKYVDARVKRDHASGRFHEMSRRSAEDTTIRITAEQLKPYRLGENHDGKLVLAHAMAGLGHVYAVIKRECDRLGIPAFTNRVQQTLCLDAVSKALGGAAYEQEWRSRSFCNPVSGHMFRYDGYFPTMKLLVEFHGYQHWTFPNIYNRSRAEFDAMVERDRQKVLQVREEGSLHLLVLREDEPYTIPAYIIERLIDEGVLVV